MTARKPPTVAANQLGMAGTGPVADTDTEFFRAARLPEPLRKRLAEDRDGYYFKRFSR